MLRLVVLLAVVGCSKPEKLSGDEAAFAKFRDQLCACRDRTCIDTTIAAANAWSDAFKGERTEKMGDIASGIVACERTARERIPVAQPPAMVTPRPSLDALLQSARDHAAKTAPNLVISMIEATRVRRDGSLADDGEVWISLSPKDEASSPGPDSCPKWTASRDGWRAERGSCTLMAPVGTPRCTFAAIWGRADREAKPPGPKALAIIRVLADESQPGGLVWAFAIDPDPVAKFTYGDDCP